MKPHTSFGAVFGMLVIIFAAANAGAQDLNPRSYANTPVGLNFGEGQWSEGLLRISAAAPKDDRLVVILFPWTIVDSSSPSTREAI
jgi:hypothetical protein